MTDIVTPPTDATATGLKEAITAAIGKADDAFGYSYRMTSLVDDVATHTLFMDGFEPVGFEDRDDGVRLIAERRNAMRADAILALLPSASVGGEREVEAARVTLISELRAVARAMELVDFHAREPDLDLKPSTCRAIINDALEALATVAAATDEGVADDLDVEHRVRIAACNAAKKSGASDALGYAVVEAVVAEFAAIRLLSQGEGK